MLAWLGLTLAIAVGIAAIPTYPRATAFCTQSILGGPAGAEIVWTAFHTPDAPETVVGWYQRRLAAALHRREGQEDIWRVPFDMPKQVLTVTSVTDFALSSSCDARPPATARSVLVMSSMHGR